MKMLTRQDFELTNAERAAHERLGAMSDAERARLEGTEEMENYGAALDKLDVLRQLDALSPKEQEEKLRRISALQDRMRSEAAAFLR